MAAILASALGFIDSNVVSIAIPSIRDSLGASLVQVQWVNNAYVLTLGTLVLVGGALGDRYGLARVFTIGITVFVAASLICALAPTPTVLIAARMVQGAGAALMVPGSLAIIARAYPRDVRPAAIGTWASASAITTAAGPIIGGLALTLGGPDMWRWIFAVNLPLGALAIWLLWRAVNSDPAQGDQRLDITGAALAIVGMGLIAWALTGGETPGGLRLAYGLTGLAVMAAFVVFESRHPAPMLDLALFQNPGFSAINITVFFLYFAMSSVFFFLPMTLIAAWGITVIDVAAAFAPIAIFVGGFSRPVGRLAARYGNRRFIAIGAALIALAFFLLGMVMPEQNFWGRVLPATTLMGFGMGLAIAPISAAVMASVDESQTGSASGINNAVSRMAGLVAVAAMGSVAAYVYAQAGGSNSFGATTQAASDVIATNRAFSIVALGAAALAALAALVAWLALPPDPQTSS